MEGPTRLEWVGPSFFECFDRSSWDLGRTQEGIFWVDAGSLGTAKSGGQVDPYRAHASPLSPSPLRRKGADLWPWGRNGCGCGAHRVTASQGQRAWRSCTCGARMGRACSNCSWARRICAPAAVQRRCGSGHIGAGGHEAWCRSGGDRAVLASRRRRSL
jgi:hypothetical protein